MVHKLLAIYMLVSDARYLSLRTAEQQQLPVNVIAGMVNEGLAMTYVIYGAICPLVMNDL